MMPLLRFRLRFGPASPLGTPLTSGTLFGHLCWARRERDGQAALRDWLGRLPEAPFAVSDGLPADMLPRPLLPSPAEPASGPLDRERLGRLEDAKRRKRLAWVGLAAWRNARVGLTPSRLDAALADPPPPGLARARAPHNTLDRRSGHTPEEAGLWFADEWWPGREGCAMDLYVRTDFAPDDVADLLRRVGKTGYGRDAALGRGQFDVERLETPAWLDEPPRAGGAARWLSLSHGTVTPNMRAARWKHVVLHGKLGRAMQAEASRPWKLPLLLAAPGATFASDDAGPFGAWLTGVHQDLPEIGHNAFHLAIPYTEAPLAGAEAA